MSIFGDPEITKRFLAKVDKGDGSGCWIWTGAINLGRGRDSERRGAFRVYNHTRIAHRAAYELFIGEIPDGLFVCHHCDNPLCVRPDHLTAQTHQWNMNDQREKGRHVPRKSKIPLDVRTEIRILYRDGGISHRELAQKFGLDNGTVSRIINFKRGFSKDLPPQAITPSTD